MSSEFFSKKEVRTAYWIEFSLVIAIAMHFFFPRTGGREDMWGHANPEYVIEMTGGRPHLRVLDGGGAEVRIVRVMPVGATDTMLSATQSGYSSRVYCIGTDELPLVFCNVNSPNLRKLNAPEFTSALLYAIEKRQWVDAVVVGTADYPRRALPNIVALFNTNGTHIVGCLDPAAP